MWIDGRGLTHYGRTSFEERKLDELRASKTIEEKYKEKVEEACRWLNDILYSDPNNPRNIKVHPLAYNSKKEIIDNFRNKLKL